MDYKNMSSEKLYQLASSMLEKDKKIIDKEIEEMTREEKWQYMSELIKPEIEIIKKKIEELKTLENRLIRELAK